MTDRVPDIPAGGTEVVDDLAERLPEEPPFLDKVQDEFRPVDLPALVAVAIALTGIFQLPLGVRRELAFAYSDPTVLTAFTANYVHFTVGHLVSNLLMFLVLVFVSYLLAMTNSNRGRFYLWFGTVLLVLPAPLSYLNLAVPGIELFIGFSGLNMALLGFVFVEFAEYLDEYVTDNFGIENAPAFFFLVTAFVAMVHAESSIGVSVTVVSLLLAVGYSLAFLLSYRPSVAGLRNLHDKQGFFELLLATVLILVVFVPISFPRNPATDSGAVNIYIHLVGFCIGFISMYVWVIVTTPAELEEAIPVDG